MSDDARPYRLRLLGDPVLEQKCERVGTVPAGLVDAMREVLAQRRGAGLAAPQLGVPISLALMRIADRDVVVLNPEIERRSPEIVTEDEGCLSIPNFYTPKARACVVRMRWQDEERADRTTVLRGYEARIAQHEIDHLNGIMITTGAPRHIRRQAEKAVEAYLKRIKASA